MGRWKTDEVDQACEAWAAQWIAHFGAEPDRASRWLGSIKCTLGIVRELHDGAGSGSTMVQKFPEVFLGNGLLVALTLRVMSPLLQEVTFRHYVSRWYIQRIKVERDGTRHEVVDRLTKPMKAQTMADRMGISRARYHQLRDIAKECIRTAMSLDTKAVAESRVMPYTSGSMNQSL